MYNNKRIKKKGNWNVLSEGEGGRKGERNTGGTYKKVIAKQ